MMEKKNTNKIDKADLEMWISTGIAALAALAIMTRMLLMLAGC